MRPLFIAPNFGYIIYLGWHWNIFRTWCYSSAYVPDWICTCLYNRHDATPPSSRHTSTRYPSVPSQSLAPNRSGMGPPPLSLPSIAVDNHTLPHVHWLEHSYIYRPTRSKTSQPFKHGPHRLLWAHVVITRHKSFGCENLYYFHGLAALLCFAVCMGGWSTNPLVLGTRTNTRRRVSAWSCNQWLRVVVGIEELLVWNHQAPPLQRHTQHNIKVSLFDCLLSCRDILGHEIYEGLSLQPRVSFLSLYSAVVGYWIDDVVRFVASRRRKVWLLSEGVLCHSVGGRSDSCKKPPQPEKERHGKFFCIVWKFSSTKSTGYT